MLGDDVRELAGRVAVVDDRQVHVTAAGVHGLQRLWPAGACFGPLGVMVEGSRTRAQDLRDALLRHPPAGPRGSPRDDEDNVRDGRHDEALGHEVACADDRDVAATPRCSVVCDSSGLGSGGKAHPEA